MSQQTGNYGFRNLAAELREQKQQEVEALQLKQREEDAQEAERQAELKEIAEFYERTISSLVASFDGSVQKVLYEFAESFHVVESVKTDSGFSLYSGGWYKWSMTHVTPEGERLYGVWVHAYLNPETPDRYLNVHVSVKRGGLSLSDVIDQEVRLAATLYTVTGWPVVYVSDYRFSKREAQASTKWVIQRWVNHRRTTNIYFGFPKFYPWWMFWKYPRNKAP